MLSTHVLPQWVGWVSIVYGLAGLGLVGFTGEAPPLLHYLMPLGWASCFSYDGLSLQLRPTVSKSQPSPGLSGSTETKNALS